MVDDDYKQPGALFRLMKPDEQERLVKNIVGNLKKVPVEIQKKIITHFMKADQSYGKSVTKGLKLE